MIYSNNIFFPIKSTDTSDFKTTDKPRLLAPFSENGYIKPVVTGLLQESILLSVIPSLSLAKTVCTKRSVQSSETF